MNLRAIRRKEIMEDVARRDAKRLRERQRYARQGRRAADVTVTLEHRENGNTVTLTGGHVKGLKVALHAMLKSYDPAVWRVLTVSTPNTILADVRGYSDRTRLPEALLLGQAGLQVYR
jgi:hypothetical protein